MKNRVRRSNSWLCFRPEALEAPIDSGFKIRSVDPVYIAVKHDELPKISSEKNFSKLKKKKTISKFVKAVFFETSLMKSRKVQQDPYHALKILPEVKSSRKSSKEDDVNSKHISRSRNHRKTLKEDDVNSTNSTVSTTSCSSSSSFSSNLSCLPDSKKPIRSNSLESKQFPNNNFTEDSKQSKTKKITKNGVSSVNGLYMLLISLMVLIFWGRVCAIVCTSTWIYLGPFRRKKEEEEAVTKPEEPKMESREYKKRVIMEGLLERSHSRF